MPLDDSTTRCVPRTRNQNKSVRGNVMFELTDLVTILLLASSKVQFFPGASTDHETKTPISLSSMWFYQLSQRPHVFVVCMDLQGSTK